MTTCKNLAINCVVSILLLGVPVEALITSSSTGKFEECEGQEVFNIRLCDSWMCNKCIFPYCVEKCQYIQKQFPRCRCEDWPMSRATYSSGDFAGKGGFGMSGDYDAESDEYKEMKKHRNKVMKIQEMGQAAYDEMIKKAKEAAAAKKKAEEEAARKHAEAVAAAKKAEEEAERKRKEAEEEAARQKAQAAAAAKKKKEEEEKEAAAAKAAAEKRAAEEAARQKALAEAQAKQKAAEEAAAKKQAEFEAAKKQAEIPIPDANCMENQAEGWTALPGKNAWPANNKKLQAIQISKWPDPAGISKLVSITSTNAIGHGAPVVTCDIKTKQCTAFVCQAPLRISAWTLGNDEYGQYSKVATPAPPYGCDPEDAKAALADDATGNFVSYVAAYGCFLGTYPKVTRKGGMPGI